MTEKDESEGIKIVNENPPVYDAIIKSGLQPHGGVVYTYGDTIYNPSGMEIPDHLIAHEEVHMDQQGKNPDAWWGRYLVDQYFRVEQECEAYAAQYAYVCTVGRCTDRNERARFLFKLASSLCSPIYGGVVTQTAAFQMIKKKSGIR